MEDVHAKRNAESQVLLREAREKARIKTGYDWEATRRDLTRRFDKEYGKPPYDWQIDVAEALILGLDAVVIAGTGAGKTIPFMMPLLLHRKKFVLIISPLKVLQEDQAARFEAIGLAAAAVNGDTYTTEMKDALDKQTLNAILTSPEMCFTHPEFRKWLRSEPTAQRLLAVIVDEAHCASQWGGDFRPHYSMLDSLRTLLPVGTPVLATSATLNPQALRDICSSLNVDLDESFYINLGNDRPNITPSIVLMNSAKDYDALNTVLPDPFTLKFIADAPKSLIFTNAIKKTQIICRHLRRLYPHLPRSAFDFLHAHRTAKAKRRVMKQFRKGKIKFLVATEAAGMGADIPDIELVIEFGVPQSLDIWYQRLGRAGRCPGLQARAIMLVEKSMFQRKKPKGSSGTKPAAPVEAEIDGGNDSEEEEAEAEEHEEGTTRPKKIKQLKKVNLDDGLVWVKNVHPILREYISTEDCRRDVADKYFNNPPRRPPTGPCCDNCVAKAGKTRDADSRDGGSDDSRPHTPEQPNSAPQSAQSTPSKHANANGKRPMTRAKRGDGPTTRRTDHLKSARAALSGWRTRTYLARYSTCAFTDTGILPDPILTKIASKRVRTLDELKALTPGWIFAARHGQEILKMLEKLDEAQREANKKVTLQNREAKKQQTQARNDAERLKKQREKALAETVAAAGPTGPFVPPARYPLTAQVPNHNIVPMTPARPGYPQGFYLTPESVAASRAGSYLTPPFTGWLVPHSCVLSRLSNAGNSELWADILYSLSPLISPALCDPFLSGITTASTFSAPSHI
ncbi:P-loop containing nucleoside triphosphate hydrolase protein [Mycena pura]|uniref:DNA 3'-5' helicase n=1 Tax=Mycena pura TaxID=153505 RepID=A0AAD6YKT1_9AGAR|nr:P-loop containing nucleoside triphosphate hydrolase protein [Mycena pura]